MQRDPASSGELEFLQALIKRGFVNIPRLLVDYTMHLDRKFDYDTLGKIFVLMASVGGPAESAFGSYVVSRRANPNDFDQLRSILADLEQKDLVRTDEEGEKVIFSFIPLFSRLEAIWEEDRDQRAAEVAAGATHPAIAIAQQMMVRPLSPSDLKEILEWVESYGFETEVVRAIIKEGQNSGNTWMSYLRQIARQWHEEGIRTVDDVEAYTQRHRKTAGKHKGIIPHLGLRRQLTLAEQAVLDKWTEEWGFSNEVIIRACQEAAGSEKPIQYVNRVLQRWHERGVKVVADVEQILSEHKRRGATDTDTSVKGRKPPAKSNVFLQREKKDDDYYDYIFKKFDE